MDTGDEKAEKGSRWFLGYTMSQPLPHFATVSYAFRHRFTAEVIEDEFRWVLEEAARAGYLSPTVTCHVWQDYIEQAEDYTAFAAR